LTAPSKELAEGANEPLVLLHFAFRAVIQEPDRRLSRRGLGRVHHRILFFVARKPGLTVGDLIATLGVTKQALHAPLQALVRSKLVRAVSNPENRRQRCLSLTARGSSLEASLSGHQRRLFAAAFRRTGPGAARGWSQVMLALALGASQRAAAGTRGPRGLLPGLLGPGVPLPG
jgi:DNA-binding MarR family transcriptional regulator